MFVRSAREFLHVTAIQPLTKVKVAASAVAGALPLAPSPALSSPRGKELQAQTDLNRAISDFEHAIGTTLTANNVSVSEGGNLTKTPGRSILSFDQPFAKPLN